MDVQEIPVELVEPNPYFTRSEDSVDVESLSHSLKRGGLIQPIGVRPHPAKPGRFQLVYGQRRLEAARKSGWERILARVFEVDDKTLVQMTVIENLHREDLSDYEKGMIFRVLSEKFGLTYEEIGDAIGHSKQYVSNHIAMTRLFTEEEVNNDSQLRSYLKKISEAHSRILQQVPDREERIRLLKVTVDEKLCTKELKSLVGRPRRNISYPEIPWATGNVRSRKDNSEHFENNFQRVCVVRVDTLNFLLSELKISSYKAGLHVGFMAAKVLKKRGIEPSHQKNWSKVLREKSRYAGWGKISTTTNNEIVVHQPCLNVKFLQGYLEGLLGVRLKIIKNDQVSQIYRIISKNIPEGQRYQLMLQND